MVDLTVAAYLDGLPEVDTARLPQGTLFWANGRIYQVIETGAGGFHKAREWRKTEATDVALIPGSFPSRHLPLVSRGRVLPVYRSRIELTRAERATCYIFPTETLALDAAYLDVALIQSAGAYVRNHGQEPAFTVTDGIHVFRLYYYRRSASGRRTDLSCLQAQSLPFKPEPHTQGPLYWRLIPHWIDDAQSTDVTQPLRLRDQVNPNMDETLPHITLSSLDR